MSRPQDIGTDFEEEFAEEMGLDVVPGSGNQWHSKLDVKGHGARWSLKATRDRSYRVTASDVYELAFATKDVGGDGRIGLMAVRLAATTDYPLDLVVMTKETFKEIAGGELTLVTETKSDAKRRLAHLPELLREESDE